jgi:TM2 domain-containing membrane protein YozV
VSALCPYCRAGFEPEDEVASCPICGVAHHAACLAENGGCTVFGCSQAPPEDPKISISGQDLNTSGPVREEPAAPFIRSHSILHLEQSQGQAPSNTPAAPPYVSDSRGVLPPPRSLAAGSAVPQNTAASTVSGYGAPASAHLYAYEPRKERVVFVLLAIFLGAFGGHNFYAGYVKKAIIQLCITVLTCFAGSIISWIWAIVEACIIDHDDDGVAFI